MWTVDSFIVTITNGHYFSEIDWLWKCIVRCFCSCEMYPSLAGFELGIYIAILSINRKIITPYLTKYETSTAINK